MIKRKDVEKYIPEGDSEYDVIVAGGGPAGIGAALASAKQGAKTLLLEGRSFFGGVAAVSLWMPFNRLLLNGESRDETHDLLVDKLKAYGKDAWREGRKSWVDGDGLHIHPDYLRLAIFELLEEAGCHYRLYSPVTGVGMKGNAIHKIITTSKEGLSEFSAKVFVDATGDGDVAYYAGASMVKGRESDGVLMPVTLGFALANVDVDRLLAYTSEVGHGKFMSMINEDAEDRYCVSEWYSFDKTTIPGVISVNNGGLRDIGNVDATKVKDLNVSERTGIQVAIDFVKLAREKKYPGLEDCYLMRVGANVGVRETRRIVGDYVLTIEDACAGPEFEDVVARRYGAVDPGGLKEDKDYKTSMKSGHAYPYRCMLPIGIENLLVAGRCGSTTHLGLTAGKSMGNMMGLGQAAGVAAALSAKQNITPRVLNVKDIQNILVSMGVKLFN